MPPIVTPSKDGPASGAVSCPRCSQPLIDPSGLGWCKACGYCRSLGEEQKLAPPSKPAPAKAAPTKPVVPGLAPARKPIWAVIMLAGIIVVAATTFALSRYVTLKPLSRAQWTTFQMLAGLALMFVGQFIGLIRLAPEDPSLTFKDAIFPFHLFGVICKHLPRGQWALNLSSWGLTLIVSALACVGGLGHWFNYLPRSR